MTNTRQRRLPSMFVSTMRREWIFLLLIGLAGLGVLFFVYQRGQDLNPDLFNYHFFSGYALLHGRFTIDIAPSGLGTFLNPITSAFTYAAFSLFAFPFSAWFVATVQWLSLPILILIAREIRFDLGLHKPGPEEFLALVLCVLAPLWWSELGTSLFSSTTAPLILLAVFLGIRAVKKSHVGETSIGVLIFAGSAAGLASGLKLTNAIFAIALLIAIVPTIGKQKLALPTRSVIALGIGIASGFALTAAWNVYLAIYWGSPLFPLYNAIFHSPYWDANNFRDQRWVFHSVNEFAEFLGEAATSKGTAKTSEIVFGDARLAIYAVLSVAGIVASAIRYCFRWKTAPVRVGSHASRFLLIFVAAGILLWAVSLAYGRYLIPIELLLGLVIWILCVQLLKDRIAVFAALISCVGISVAVVQIPDWGHTPAPQNAMNVFGLDLPAELRNSPAEYLILGNFNSFALVYFDPRSRFLRGDFSGYAEGRLKNIFDQSTRPKRIFVNDDASINDATATAKRLGYRLAGSTRDCLQFSSKRDKYLVCDLEPMPSR